MTGKQWFKLQCIVTSAIPLTVSRLAQAAMCIQIILRTLSWHRLDVTITKKEFESGEWARSMYPGSDISIPTLYRERKVLVETGAIGYAKPDKYWINAPDLVRLIFEQMVGSQDYSDKVNCPSH